MVDLAKQVMTLDAAVLVLSMGSVEKILNLATATRRKRKEITWAWGLLLLSIVLGIASLVFAHDAVAASFRNVDHSFRWLAAEISMISSMLSFVFALILLLVTAVDTLFAQSTN